MIGGWGAAIRRLLLAVAVLVALGLWQDNLAWLLLAGTSAYLLWNLINLYRLDRWMSEPGSPNPPDVPGIWGQVIYRIAAIQRKSRKQKKRMAKLLVEFRKSTEAMPDSAVVLDKDDRIAWFNSAATRMLGLSAGRDMGQRIDNLLRAPAFRSYLREKNFLEPLLMASPVHGEVLLSTRIIPYGKGQRLLLARDVTERAQLEKMRKDFVANASHELRTPLTVLSGYLETMQEDQQLDRKWQGPVREMRRQAQRMERLVADLLELSRLEAADAEAKYQRIDMQALLKGVSEEAAGTPGPSARVSVRMMSGAGLFADAAGLHSVCQNLLANALRYTPETGHVEIGWRSDETGGYLWVRDDGPGIEPEHLSRITERFYRADPGRSAREGGTGLGLAIVKHVLELHGAHLHIESTPGQGATFTCVFPAARVAPAAA